MSTCYVAHETSQGFPTGAGSRIPVAYDKGGPVKFMVFTARGRMNLYEGKVFIKAGVCNWLPLYYHTGMYRVPYCYIAVNCDKERLGYLHNLGSLSRNQI